jgi:TPR repeat protein
MDDWQMILNHAEERDNSFAKALTAFCYTSETVLLIDKNKIIAQGNATAALEYVSQRVKQKNKLSQFYLGHFYEKGLGVKHDLREATNYYKLAAKQGHARAQMFSGHLL